MARLENQKQSNELVDRTAYTPMENFLVGVGNALNPVTAARKVRMKMIEKGIIEPQVSDMFGHANMKEWLDQVGKAVALKQITDNMDLMNPEVLASSEYGDLKKPRLDILFPDDPRPRKKGTQMK